ncbi:MAG: glycoside hydrolase family 5 protein [Alphaproteobacteria bacterium]|nr:glycoside hydrolase family 5 protein [Alphaproteobacteria bacterium]
MLKWILGAALALLLPLGTPAGAAPALNRGINILGYDPIWRDPAKARFQVRHFAAIRRGGFDFVRVNLQAFRHMDAANRLDGAWLKRLDWVVANATAAGLSVILDEHDFNACSDDPALCRVRLGAFWSQVAPRYRRAPRSVLFELLNEPHGKLDAAAWNGLLEEMLAIVRRTNPTRTVVVGPTQWNSLAELDSLRLPASDRNILVTYHYYEPFRFTHQGASWAKLTDVHGISWGGAEDRARLDADFDRARDWSRRTGRPLLLGEFGAYDRSGTPIALRAAYTAAVARAAERRGFAWAYWQFDSDFVAWDMQADGWVGPIRDALIPR